MSFERVMEFSAWDGGCQCVITLGIQERGLPYVSDEELALIQISREYLHRVFAEGMRQMEEGGYTASDRIRPCADQTRDGEWVVHLVRYSEDTDPFAEKELLQ